MTLPGPVLSLEVFDEIINQSTNETSTLKSCSLVCRSFHRTAQKILFNSLDVDVNRPREFVLIVEQAPHLIEYIQKLRIYGNSRPLDLANTTGLANALGIFSRKGKSFPINLRLLALHSLPWRSMPLELQDALVLLITVHSIRDIVLDGDGNYPADLVQNLPPLLKHLSLVDTTFSSLPTTRKELPKLESLTIALYDLSARTARTLNEFPDNAMECIANTTQLKTFNGLSCKSSSMPLFEQTLRPSSNSLKHLRLGQFR